MTPALDVDIRHTAGEFNLAVQFTVESGLAVLFGPSGAGKSLTLSIIAGLVKPDHAKVSIAGHLVNDTDARPKLQVRPQDRYIGMVFQDGLLFPHKKVLDNVAMAVRQEKPRTRRREVAREWLERVGAGDLAGRKPMTLSGGQRQRVALARGMAGEPKLLILDEPLSSLDQDVRRQMRALIREVVTASGVPSLLVTHDLEEAEELGDTILSYRNGGVTGSRIVNRTGRQAAPAESPVTDLCESESHS